MNTMGICNGFEAGPPPLTHGTCTVLLRVCRSTLNLHHVAHMRPSCRGPVAQLVEQLTFNQWVTGSNPVGLTTSRFSRNLISEPVALACGSERDCPPSPNVLRTMRQRASDHDGREANRFQQRPFSGRHSQ